MSLTRRADYNDATYGRTPTKRQHVATAHAKPRGHQAQHKYKPHVDSGVGKDFHSVPYPLTLLPKKTWQALNNGDAKGGVCSRCAKDQNSTPWQRKLFLVAERLSWEQRTTSLQQREQNEVALWAINAELGVYDPAVDDDDVVIGGRHSRENEWYPYRNKIEAELALRIVAKADILTELSWPLWKACTGAALDADDVEGIGDAEGTLHQTGRSSPTRQPLGELSSNSSQSPRVSPGGKEKLRPLSRSSPPAAAKTRECGYVTLADFYRLLDKIERTSPIGARYLEAYAERLHVDVCKDCWFQNTMADISDEEDEDEDDPRSAAKPASQGADLRRPIELIDSPLPRAGASRSLHVPAAHRITPLHRGPHESQPRPPDAIRNAAVQRPVHLLAYGPHPGFPGSSTPGTISIGTGSKIFVGPVYGPMLEQRRVEFEEWLHQHFVTDPAAHTTVTHLWQTYQDKHPKMVPRLPDVEFIPTVKKAFPGSRSKYLSDGTYVVEGIRQKEQHASTGDHVVWARDSAVVQDTERPDHFSQWLRTYYEQAPNVEIPNGPLLETYGLHCNAKRGTKQFLPDFERSLLKIFPTAQVLYSRGAVRHVRLKPASMPAAQPPSVAITSSRSIHGGIQSPSTPGAIQAGGGSSGQQPVNPRATQVGSAQLSQQTVEWLRRHYEFDRTGEVKQLDLYKIYLRTRPAASHCTFKKLMAGVTRTFSTPTVMCASCKTPVFKSLKFKSSRIHEGKRCTPPPSQQASASSRASASTSRLSAGATTPSRNPPWQQAGPSTSGSRNPQQLVEATSSNSTIEMCRKWLSKHYIADPKSTVRRASVYLRCRNHCSLPNSTQEAFPSEFGFCQLVFRLFPSTTISFSSSKADAEIIGIRPRYPSEEPERTKVWLTTNFIAEEHASTAKDEIWEQYKSDVDLQNVGGRMEPLEFAGFLRRLRKTFPRCTTQYHERTYKVSRIVGVRRRRVEEEMGGS
ncbi:hypothetical protein BST61_g8449 [Cercospora zeina]